MIWKISKANEFHHSYEEEFAYGGGIWYAGLFVLEIVVALAVRAAIR